MTQNTCDRLGDLVNDRIIGYAPQKAAELQTLEAVECPRGRLGEPHPPGLTDGAVPAQVRQRFQKFLCLLIQDGSPLGRAPRHHGNPQSSKFAVDGSAGTQGTPGTGVVTQEI